MKTTLKYPVVIACIAFSAIASIASIVQAANPPFPVFTSAAQINLQCEKSLKQAVDREKRLAAMPDKPSAKLLGELDDLNIALEDAGGALSLVGNVHPDKAVRDAAEACTLKVDAFQTAFYQNSVVYGHLKQAPARDPIDERNKRLAIDGFEDSGVGLPADKRARAKAINDEISKVGQDFSRTIREDKTISAFTLEELKGVPEGVYKTAKRDADGKVLLGLDYPSYGPVMDYAENSAARERMWRAKQGEGGVANLALLTKLANLRREYAQLFGFDSYADFVLRRRMAANSASVDKFLGEVRSVVTEREKRDLAELAAAKAAHMGVALEGTKLNRWDVAFYTERVKKAKYAVDQEQFRQYFPPEESLQFVFKLAEKLFGVRYTAIKQPLWHPEARAFAVHDIATKRFMGNLYVDLYPRKDKYNHAAVWSYRNVALRTNRTPQAGMVVNFNREGLSLDELDTLLHEFGHSIHALMSQTRYNAQGGTNVQLDFVEAPSQMLEEWAYDATVLAGFKEVCAKCKLVPAELLVQVKKAKSFGKGIRYARQLLYASYDFALNGKTEQDPMALWARMEGATPLGTVDGTIFPAGFGHLAGGYAAGYYSYLWSEVIGEDLKTAFAPNWLDAKVGKRYRDTVLSKGGQDDAKKLLANFLGREPSSDAFFKFLSK